MHLLKDMYRSIRAEMLTFQKKKKKEYVQGNIIWKILKIFKIFFEDRFFRKGRSGNVIFTMTSRTSSLIAIA